MQPEFNNQAQPAMAPMQPAQSAPQPAPQPAPGPQPMPTNYQTTPISPAPKKQGGLALILAIIFGLTTAVLAVVLVISLTNKKTVEPVKIGDTVVPASTPLSKVEVPTGSAEDILKNALSGRTFTVNSSYEEFVTFTSDSKFEFSYFREPAADRQKLQPSTEAGTYTVKGNAITLSNGETFQITGDYLVKTSAQNSKNETAVYFDSLQLQNALPNISVALSNYLNTTKKTTTPNYEKVRLDRMYCHADYSIKTMTNADSYLCDMTYSYLFDETKLATLMKAAKTNYFSVYCAQAKSPYRVFMTEGGICNNDNTVTTWNYVIVRTDNVSYRVTGLFRTIEGATEAMPRY